MRERLAEALCWVTFTVGTLVMGGAALETTVYIPNWVHDMPSSLAATRAFLAVRTPGDFFQVLAPLTIVAAAAATAAAWRHRRVRHALMAGTLLLVGAEVMTFVLVYPQIRLLLAENAAGRSIQELGTARETLQLWGFQVRLLMMSVAVFLLYGFAARTITLDRGRRSAAPAPR